MVQKTLIFALFIGALLIFAGCAVEQQWAVPTALTTSRAAVRGEIKETVALYEAQAQQAERDAAASRFPQQFWTAALAGYREAARAAWANGQLQKAIALGEKALEIAQRTKAPVYTVGGVLDHPPLPELSVITALISVYVSVRDFDRAKARIDKGLTLAEEVQPPRRVQQEGILYAHLGQHHSRRREYDKAAEAFLIAAQSTKIWASYMASFRRRDNVEVSESRLVGILISLGSTYRLVGRLEDAREQYQEALSYINTGGTRSRSEASLYNGLGEIDLQQKRFTQALEQFRRALAVAEKQQSPALISAANRRLGNLYRMTGRPSEAISYYQTAIQQTEATRSLLQSQEYRQSYFEGELGDYTNLIGVLLEAGKTQDAFNYSERARSRTFLDVLGSKVQLARSGTLMEHERALQARISVLRAMIENHDEESSETPDLRRDLADAVGAYNDYLGKIRKENKEQASLMSVEPLTLKDVQERLDPGVTMLEYFVSGNNVWLWVVEKDRVEFVSSSIARKDLVTKVTELRDTIHQFGEKERFNSLSQDLHKLLIQPALAHIRGKELIIVPHDVLHYLPFQALLGSDSRYLIEKYPIYYLSSASLMQFTQEKRRAMGDKVLAFGNPDLNDPKKALQFAEIEAKEIKNLYPQSTIYLQKEASEEKAKTFSSQNDIIHFASHAELSADDPLASAILLAKSDKEDGRLEVREIFSMDLKASLVVLSACETGLGKLSSGDELVGLTRAFIYAGTPSVVASLWSVEDSSTAQLMASFYKNLKTMTKVEALRQAQLNLIRGNINSDLLARRGIGGVGKLGEVPRVNPAAQPLSPDPDSVPSPVSISTSHPYFWAPFILVGEGK